MEIKSYKSFVAKNQKEEKLWLPLWIHSVDTYSVMMHLLDSWMPADRFSSAFIGMSSDDLRRLAGFIALIHDFGKASVTFQS